MAHLNALWWLYVLGDSALSSSGVSEVDSSCKRKEDMLKSTLHSTARWKDQQTCWTHLAIKTFFSVRSRIAFIHQGPESRGSKPRTSQRGALQGADQPQHRLESGGAACGPCTCSQSPAGEPTLQMVPLAGADKFLNLRLWNKLLLAFSKVQ